VKNIIIFIKNFIDRDGSYVFTATIISRLLSFLASWIALQLIDDKGLGSVLFAYSIVQFLIPFGGLGLYQGLERYGALLENTKDKENLFLYVFKKGMTVSFLLTIITIIISFFISFELKNVFFYLSILSFSIITNYLFHIIKIQFRLKHENKNFAYLDITHSIILLISVLVLSYYFKEIGYSIALITTPLLASLFFIKRLKIKFKKNQKLPFSKYEFWRYSFFGGLASVAPISLIVIDLLLVGHLLKNPEKVTIYKYVSIIPSSIIFLPQVFILTDFVSFTEKIKDKKYIFKYIKSYMLLFTLISVVFCAFFYLFSKQTLSIFNPNYVQYSDSFLILVFGVCGILIFRGLFGNLLSSIGKIEVNYYIVLIALIINVIGNYYLIPLYGIKGAAITSAFLMWFTGVFSYIWFLILYKKFS